MTESTMDYLMEEVLHQQPERVQHFLLHTALLDRMCGSLCDAVLCDDSASGQQTLEYLEQANLFIVPLDNERRWYRYHHLFAELLRQRLHQSLASAAESAAEYHVRASQWYEENGLELEAFHHATSADDFERAERLIEGGGMPLHFRGAVTPVLAWLKTLPATVLDAWPSLWTAYASTLLASGQTTAAEEKLQAAEAVLQRTAPDGGPNTKPDEKTLDLIGRIAAIRSTSAASQQRVEEIITYSQQALQYLHPDNIAFRTSTAWKLGYAYHLRGDRAAARRAYGEVIALGQASGNTIFTIMASLSLGGLQLKDNQLHQAVQTYQHALELFDGKPLPTAYEAHLGLAKIFYQWNDLDAVEQHIQQGIELARQYENSDQTVPFEVLLTRTKLARGDVSGAAAALAKVEHFVRQHTFEHWLPDIAAVQVLLLLHPEKLTGATRDENLAKAVQLTRTHNLPASQARTHLACGDAAAALAILASTRQEAEAKGWADEVLQVMVLQTLSLAARSDTERAVQLLSEALALAESSGFVRLFVDEGVKMAQLLHIASQRGATPEYVEKLLAVFAEMPQYEQWHVPVAQPDAQPLVEPLSQRELEILHLIAAGKKNQEIADALFISLNTVRYHTKNLYGKLGVNKRTQAVAKARALNVL